MLLRNLTSLSQTINNEQFKELGITDIKDTYIVNYKTGEVYNETQKTTNDGNILYICAVE